MTYNFKFFPFKDFIFSVVPTAASYEGYLKDLVPLELLSNKFVELGVGAGLSLLLALIFYRENVRSYKKSLAEILATGYFSNFTNGLVWVLKREHPLNFIFTDGMEYQVDPENVEVFVEIPKSLSELREYSKDVKKEYKVAYLKSGPKGDPLWIRGKVNENGKMIIPEYPRTLFSLSTYLRKDFSTEEKAEKNSKKLYRYFKYKFDELVKGLGDNIDEERIHFSAPK